MVDFLAVTTEQLTQLVSQLGEKLVVASGILGGTSGVVALILGLVKIGLNYKASKKSVTLSEKTTQDLANSVKDEFASGVEVDISKQIDTATNKRLTEVEEKVNEFAEKLDATNEGIYKIATAVSEFRSISADARSGLTNYVADNKPTETEKLEVVEKVVAVIEKGVEVAAEVKNTLF